MTEIISQEHKKQIIELINMHIPNCKILVFGSRISGTAKQYSDLDIALHSSTKIPLDKLFAIENDFSQTEIPFKLDLSDYARLSDEFKTLIDKTCVDWSKT